MTSHLRTSSKSEFVFDLFSSIDALIMMIGRGIAMLTPSQIEFGLIPHDHWSQPEWIDEEKATIGRNTMKEKGIIYAGSVPYRNMCRFNSGVSCFPSRFKCCVSLFLQYFYRHPLLQKYRWDWRIE